MLILVISDICLPYFAYEMLSEPNGSKLQQDILFETILASFAVLRTLYCYTE